MLITLTAAMPGAGDLGFLLHKHPDRTQSLTMAGGVAHVFWPEVTQDRATVALLVEVDPIALVKGRHQGAPLAQYVNDRPYTASSMLSVALRTAFRTAMAGRCEARPELVDRPLPLQVHVPVVASSGGAALATEFFAPLGWGVVATPLSLDPEVPAWGDSPYLDLRLSGQLRLADALAHLYVLVPALDGGHHHFIGQDEVDKLLRAGTGWLPDHPARELITARYLGRHRELVTSAAARLAAGDADAHDGVPDQSPTPDEPAPAPDEAAAPEAPATPLARLRTAAVVAALRAEGASTVVDLGCGEGALLRELVPDPAFTRVLGVDVSPRALALAARRLHLDRMPDTQRARLELVQSSATYRDDRLAGYDAVVLMEVVEHLDPPRLPALERSVFAHARPAAVIVTTPNAEHNALYEHLPAGALRHRDHRFEWTRAQFAAWAQQVADAHGYGVRHEPVGPVDPGAGPPTQMAVFTRSPSRSAA